MKRLASFFLTVTALLLFPAIFSTEAVASDKEYAVKAAFVTKLSHFITWPEQSISNPLKLCLLGDNPFGAQFKTMRNGKQNTPRFNVEKIDHFAADHNCDLLYISKSKTDELSSILDLVRNSNHQALTFADTKGFASNGVIINFFVESSKVGFEINWKVAKQAGFSISSRVLKLARIVDE